MGCFENRIKKKNMKRVVLSLSVLLLVSVSAFARITTVGTPNDLRNLSGSNKRCSSIDTILVTAEEVDMSGISFSPMCASGFEGVFDGQGHIISNLSIHEDPAWFLSYSNIAFISVLEEGGVLKNVTFVNPDIQSSNSILSVSDASVAVAVGELRGGSIENVHVNGGTVYVKTTNNSTVDAGGIAGTAESGTISESDGDIDITNNGKGSISVGGICGSITGDVTLSAVTYTGNASSIAGTTSGNNGISIKYGALTVNEKNSVKTAFIDGTYTSAGAVEIPADIVVSGVTMDRTFNADKIATLYVPFEIEASKVQGAEVYKFKTVVKNEEDGRWKFKVSTATTVKPNTPYVVVPKGTQIAFNITEPVTLNTTTTGETTEANNWEFIGAYQYKKFLIDKDNPIYLFADEERDGAKLGEFVKIAEGAFINPMRAYLVYHKSAAGLQKSASGSFGSDILLPDELDIEVENENGIVVQTGRLNTFTGAVRMDRWFDLKGRKLNSRPSTKGTYYKNGKNVIIK